MSAEPGESWLDETMRYISAQRDDAQRRLCASVIRADALEAERDLFKCRLDQLRTELAPLFHMCQWAHAVAGTALTLNGEVAAAEQALISFLHEPMVAAKAAADEAALKAMEQSVADAKADREEGYAEDRAARHRAAKRRLEREETS